MLLRGANAQLFDCGALEGLLHGQRGKPPVQALHELLQRRRATNTANERVMDDGCTRAN